MTPSSRTVATSEEESAKGRALERPRLAVTVLGAHRSGTSAIARILALLGADLPRNLMPASADNETGYWEPQRIAELNDELLDTGSSSWDDVSPFPASWYGSPPEAEFRSRAVQLLGDEYAESRLFVLKDPRISRIVPFWVSALADFGATPSFVIVVRNPLEVAASLRERNEFSIPKGLLLWLRHILDAERDTRGHPRAFISYERLLHDWESQVQAISERLQISWPRLNHDTRNEADQFLVSGRRHQRFSPAEIQEHPSVVNWVKRCHAEFDQACETGETPSAEVLTEIAQQVRQADRAYGAILAAAQSTARRRGKLLEQHREEAKRMTGELDARRARAGQAQLELRRSDDEIASQAEEIALGGRELGRLKAEAASHGIARGQFDAEIERSRTEIDGLTAEVARTRSLEQGLKTAIADAETRLHERQRELTQARSEHAARGRELAALRQLVDEQRRDLADQAREVERLSVEANRRDADHQELRRAIESRESELEQRQTALAEAEEQRELLGGQLRETEAQLEQSRAEAARLGAEASGRKGLEEDLRAQLGESEAAVAERARTIEQLRTEIRARTAAADEASQRLEDLSAAFGRMGGEVEALRERFAAIRDETALAYLGARPPGRLRLRLKLLGWGLTPTGFRRLRSFRTIRRSGRFDHDYYVLRYPDVATSRQHPILHYVERGASESRDPSPEFSTNTYVARHSELAGSGENPFAHFLRATDAAADRADKEASG